MSSGNWKNNDGLYIEYGTSKPTVDVAGEYSTAGDMREVDIRLDLVNVVSLAVAQAAGTAGTAIISQNFRFPAGCRIARIEVITDVPATGGTTLDLGLMKEDRVTALSLNGLIAALTLASIDTVGETTAIIVGSPFVGALVGTSTAEPTYLCANWNSTAFTAGSLNIRIFYYGRGVITQ